MKTQDTILPIQKQYPITSKRGRLRQINEYDLTGVMETLNVVKCWATTVLDRVYKKLQLHVLYLKSMDDP